MEDFGRLAFEVASRRSFPRLVGRPGEKVGRVVAAAAFRAAGLEVREEGFNCSDYPIRVAARWALAPTGFLLLAAALLLPVNAAIALVISFLAVAPAFFFASKTSARSRVFNHYSANVIGEFSPPGATRELILVAHHDSKSQAFPIWLRVLLFLVGGFGSIGLSMLLSATALLALPVIDLGLDRFFLIAALALLAVDLSLLFNTVGDRSDGALDNATGVGIVAEVAARLAAGPVPGLKVTALAAGAEEIGLWGGNDFVGRHRGEWGGRAVVYNFDGCGGGSGVSAMGVRNLGFKRHSPELVALAAGTARELGIGFRQLHIPIGMNTDFSAFIRAGVPGIDFVSAAGSSHSVRDTIAHVRQENLAEHVRLAVALARRLPP